MAGFLGLACEPALPLQGACLSRPTGALRASAVSAHSFGRAPFTTAVKLVPLGVFFSGSRCAPHGTVIARGTGLARDLSSQVSASRVELSPTRLSEQRRTSLHLRPVGVLAASEINPRASSGSGGEQYSSSGRALKRRFHTSGCGGVIPPRQQ